MTKMFCCVLVVEMEICIVFKATLYPDWAVEVVEVNNVVL